MATKGTKGTKSGFIFLCFFVPFVAIPSPRTQTRKHWYHAAMRLQQWLFLLIGFGLGFAGLYTWTKQRAPDIVRAMPLPVDPNVPTDLSSANRSAADGAA